MKQQQIARPVGARRPRRDARHAAVGAAILVTPWAIAATLWGRRPTLDLVAALIALNALILWVVYASDRKARP